MEVLTQTTAYLSYEDVKQAIAQFASSYLAGDSVFDAETVVFDLGHDDTGAIDIRGAQVDAK